MLILWHLACVIDNGVQGKDDAVTGFDTGTPFDPFDSATDSESGEDPCNGLDDDGDGLVDEDYADHDADGVADCVDDDCALQTRAAEAVPLNDACSSSTWTPAGDITEFVVEWTITGPMFLSSPVIANLTDDDGDGDIDRYDTPDILAVDYNTGDLYNVSGADGSEHWRLPLGTDPMSVAAADVDRDGTVNIVTQGTRGLCALEPDGAELWCTSGPMYTYSGGPTIADLEGDGRAEVIARGYVLDAETGDVRATGPCVNSDSFAVTGDLDGDGVKEIVCGGEAWFADGSLFWSTTTGPHDFAALVDVDADDVPEVLVSGWTTGARILAWDGTELVTEATNGEYSAACVADFNGDGAPEFGLPAQTGITIVDRDLHPLWSYASRDMSGAASCSAFDFDVDGAYELVYADENTLYVFDGTSGDILFQWDDHASGTMWEYPTMVDVDNDGSTEIVVFESFYGNTGMAVIGSPTDSWPPTGPNWAQYAFDGGNVSDEGEVLADPPPPWRDGGFIHARPPGFLDPDSGTWSVDPGEPDLGISVTDLCTADCEDGPVALALSATNAGPSEVAAVIVVYADDETGLREVARVDVTVASGMRSDPIVLSLSPADVGLYGLKVTIARADGGDDCDDADNAATWRDWDCP